MAATDLQCPTTGETCPYRQHLVNLHQERVNPNLEEALPEDCKPELDGMKLFLQLSEHELVARGRGCTGPAEGICETAEWLGERKSRRHFIDFGRKLIRISSSRGQV